MVLVPALASVASSMVPRVMMAPASPLTNLPSANPLPRPSPNLSVPSLRVAVDLACGDDECAVGVGGGVMGEGGDAGSEGPHLGHPHLLACH